MERLIPPTRTGIPKAAFEDKHIGGFHERKRCGLYADFHLHARPDRHRPFRSPVVRPARVVGYRPFQLIENRQTTLASYRGSMVTQIEEQTSAGA